MNTIPIRVKNKTWHIPNAWELLTPEQYLQLLADIEKMAQGKLPMAILRVNYVCNIMGWNIKKIDEEGMANLAWLAEQIDFIFNIAYPDNDEALQDLDPYTKKKLKKTAPEQITNLAVARYLARLDYKYVLDSCFCAQLVPTIEVGKKSYSGYTIKTSFDTLTCSLTALQYIEARKLIGAAADKLPLLAAILYHPGKYNSESAHALASEFTNLPESLLQAIAFNFQCFNNYLFSKTEFSLLTAGSAKKESSITTGALESLYNLPADGLGDITAVEQMNLIKYLTILRKKLIESVRTLADLDKDHTEIADKTGLPIQIINKILK